MTQSELAASWSKWSVVEELLEGAGREAGWAALSVSMVVALSCCSEQLLSQKLRARRFHPAFRGECASVFAAEVNTRIIVT